MNENNEQTIHKSVQQDGKPIQPELDRQPEVYEFDPLGEDTEFTTIGDLKDTYENLKVVRFKHPTKENEFIKFLIKRCDPGTSMLTYGTSVIRSAIRLAAINERLTADKDATVDIYEFIDDLRSTKEFTVLTVAMGLVEPRIPAKQVNEILPDYMISALSAEINKGVVVLNDATSRFPDSDREDTTESGAEQPANGTGTVKTDRDVGNGLNKPEIQPNSEQSTDAEPEMPTRENSD